MKSVDWKFWLIVFTVFTIITVRVNTIRSVYSSDVEFSFLTFDYKYLERIGEIYVHIITSIMYKWAWYTIAYQSYSIVNGWGSKKSWE